MRFNGFIYCKELKKIVNIEYNTSHLLYYWYRYVVYLIENNESSIKKEVGSDMEEELKELEDNTEKKIEKLCNKQKKEKQNELVILNRLTVNDSINFLFALDDDIKNPEFYIALSTYIQQAKHRKPLICIGAFDLDSVETYTPVDYLDSSIWNYYINVLGNIEEIKNSAQGGSIENEHSIFSEKLSGIVEIILTNYTEQLYNITVAKEFIEFQSRLLGNSYLGLPGGHAADVSPFVFHSEQNMEKLSLDVLKKNLKLLQKEDNKIDFNIKWNILLLDDYAEQQLKGGAITKLDILKTLLNNISNINNKFRFSTYNYNENEMKVSLKKDKINFHFFIDTSEKINDAIDKINSENENVKYDIILLDYLLGQKPGSSSNREYGDEFLNKLKDDEKLLNQKGPLDKFWIFPISSFSNAMISKLEEEGIGRIDDNWFIMDGADMINTPNLFIYNFLKLIYLQLNTAIVTIQDISEFIMNNKTDGSSDSNPLKNKEENEDTDIYDIRQDARRLYGIFMHKFGLRGALKNDAKQGSVFAQSVLDYMYKERYDDLKFYEYVRKLLYLVGFSTHHDAALMWDLLTYIDGVTASFKKDGTVNNEQVNSFLKAVRRYITRLKNHYE